jgi:hypothetical protein
VTSSRTSLSFAPRHQRGRARRPLLVLLGLVVVALMAWAIVVGVIWTYAWLQLGPEEVAALEDDEAALGSAAATAPPDATTVLVITTEERDPTVPREPALAAPPVLVQTGGPREGAAALVLPSELPVMVDGLGQQSLAELQEQGGAELLVRAVVDHTEVRVDHVVSATADALPRLLDEVGPVEVCDDAGCAELSGEQLRAERAGASPISQVRTSAQVVRAVAESLDPVWAASRPLAAWRLVDVLSDEILTDVTLRPTELFQLADALAAEQPLDVDVVPLVVNPQSEAVIPLLEPAQLRFHHLQAGTPFPADAPEDEEARLLRESQVAVLNGAGVDGLAATVALQLEAGGFDVVGTGNAPSFGRDTTTVGYVRDDPVAELAAVRIAESLEGSQLEPGSRRPLFEGERIDVVVILGSDRADD